MKIIVLQDRLRSGGTERQSILLTRAFAAAGHEATLLTFRPGGTLSPSAPDLDLRSLQPFDTGLDWFAPGLQRSVARIGPDVVLCMGRMANAYSGRIQRLNPRSAVVATLRTGKRLPLPFRRSLRTVRAVIANSREARDRAIASQGVLPARIGVISNSLVFPLEGSRDEAFRARFGAGPGTSVFLCVAMFRPEKNQRELIETLEGLPRSLDWQLWLAGDGPCKGECEAAARTKGLEERVRFLGFLEDPGRAYAAADAAVLASSSESLSNFLIEAQASGLPAIAFEAQGVSECMVPGQTGWVVPRGDRAAFRRIAARLAAESPAARSARSAQARQFARAAFDPARQAAAYLAFFAQLAPTPQAVLHPRTK